MDISLLSTIDDIEKLRNLALAMVQNAMAENAEKEKLLQQNSDLLQRILLLEEMLKLARQQRFGKKGETLAGMQRSLLEGDVDADIAAVEAQLSQSEWVLRGQNLLITGPCGCGKTYVGCALGNNACQRGYSVQYWRLSRLLGELTHGRADGSYRKQLTQLSKTQLLILDDWGLEPLQAAHRNDLLELMDDRYGKSATVMISQLPTEEWYGCVGDNTLADAILDRLMHNAQRLDMKGESMRKRLAQVD
ncbi:ATP-binding protein [Salmonella enterica]|nr:ATP-binding protein [Salmonella enterica]